jgi:hypothetical protein
MVTSSSEQVEATIGRVVDQLQNRMAAVEIAEVRLSRDLLSDDIVVTSQVGHKFPSGFPSRRAWLHVTLTDAAGTVLFESGRANPDGSIEGNSNDADPAGYEPHYQEITDPDQVQIYETILTDTEGKVTTTLLHGAGYLKDNRLLPLGSDPSTGPVDVAVRGAAREDGDFGDGGDVIHYVMDLAGGEGPFRLTVELQYQSIGYRWAQNLAEETRGRGAAEVDSFLEYYRAVPNIPEVIARSMIEKG